MMREGQFKPSTQNRITELHKTKVTPLNQLHYHCLIGCLSKTTIYSVTVLYFGNTTLNSGHLNSRTPECELHMLVFPITGHNSFIVPLLCFSCIPVMFLLFSTLTPSPLVLVMLPIRPIVPPKFRLDSFRSYLYVSTSV
jgi:hypothetical protein